LKEPVVKTDSNYLAEELEKSATALLQTYKPKSSIADPDLYPF
jgi:hypothetical protein